ncbi:MAG: CAP domain-containing protein [Aphanothece sp. CMT-3BRIN-NPC111]|jgi:uncharacterized protein YkwD|nr:CAP domain-containing protein [Aphanothece sp. CMT-3BRIN-NPC111]
MHQVRFFALKKLNAVIAPLSVLATFSVTLLLSSCAYTSLVSENLNPTRILSKLPSPAAVESDTPTPANLSAIERGIVAETNRARTNPVAYAAQLQKLKRYYKGKLLQLPGQIPILTHEGVKPVDETIRFLKSAKPVPAIGVSRGMSLAAKDHVKDQGPKGATGHYGSNGSSASSRVSRYGSWQRIVGENISYGPNTAQQVVMQLLIDDNVPDRGHRKNLFQRDYRVSGVACGPHKTYRIMCVIDYAGGYKERR